MKKRHSLLRVVRPQCVPIYCEAINTAGLTKIHLAKAGN